jgi:hypothetical protein
VIEPELDRVVAEGCFWKPRPYKPTNETAKRPMKKKARTSDSALAQPTLEFFNTRRPTPDSQKAVSGPEPKQDPTASGAAEAGLTAASAKRKRPSQAQAQVLTSYFLPTNKKK